MERGVVFTPIEILKVTNGCKTGASISSEDLNYLILYWDKLVSPTIHHFHLGMEIEDELIKCGILTRPVFEINGPIDSNLMPDFIVETHAQTIEMLRRSDNSVDWRMHFLNDIFTIPKQLSVNKEVLRFEFLKLLPVPPRETPLHDILEFKVRRSDELQALHGYLDELYLDVLSSGDMDLSKAKSISGLKKALSDLDDLSQSAFRFPIKFNLSSSYEFDLSQLCGGASAAYAAMHSQKPFEAFMIGAALTTLGGIIKIRPQIQSILNSGDPKLAYLTKAKGEGLVKSVHSGLK